MKKYKLIKEYPSGPEFGTIITKELACGFGSYYVSKNKKGRPIFGNEEIENYPEFWEEVKEEEYQILEFKDKPNTGRIYYQQGNDLYRPSDQKLLYNKNELLKDNNILIHSVRRLSDDEVFTVGDKVNRNWVYGGEITQFKLEDELQVVVDDAWCCSINDISKEQEPLFKTEDGYDVYEGDKCCVVDKKTLVSAYYTMAEDSHDGALWIPHKNLYFKKKENAERWIEDNEPRYSKNDIQRAFNVANRRAGLIAKPIETDKIFWKSLNDRT